MIVAASERQVRIEVGYGLEGTLTDALTKYIIETSILPRFKAGDLPGGIKMGVEQIARVLGGDPDGLKRATAQSSSPVAGRSTGDMPIGPVIVLAVDGVGLRIF